MVIAFIIEKEEMKMPTNPYLHIHAFVCFLDIAKPSSILDVGVGNGKIGFIARDYLDVSSQRRYLKKDWDTRIDGIEIFDDCIQDHQRSIYDEIHLGNAFEVIDSLGAYDMIVLGDVLELFEKKAALALLDKCVEHTNEWLIICVALGEEWRQPGLHDNPHERHRSFWNYQEIKPFVYAYEVFNHAPGCYGAFLIKKEDYINFREKKKNLLDIQNQICALSEIRTRYNLTPENISRIDLSRFTKYIADLSHFKYFFDNQFKEHYSLIAHLSTCFNDSLIFDIGTNKGYSALALSYNPSNRIVSYDIVDVKKLNHMDELEHIEYLLGDALADQRLLSSPMIMLDTEHDGVFEQELYRFLRSNRYKGTLFLDDIHLNPAMKEFWGSIQEPKEDITDLGHHSGSGLVVFP